MATKKPNLISIPIRELLECLVIYSEYLNGHSTSSKVDRRHFTIDTPKQKLAAIETILFGDELVKGKRGNRSFEEGDKEELLMLMNDTERDLKNQEELLNAAVELVQARSAGTDDESIRARLKKVLQKMKKEKRLENFDFSMFENDDGWDDFVYDDIIILGKWLDQYRDQILRYYSFKHNKDYKIEKLSE